MPASSAGWQASDVWHTRQTLGEQRQNLGRRHEVSHGHVLVGLVRKHEAAWPIRDALVDAGTLYADSRANAVFLL